MKELILVINCGSSTIKFSVMEDCQKRLSGHLDITPGATFTWHWQGKKHQSKFLANETVNISTGLQRIKDVLIDLKLIEKIAAVGHRVVHGGEYFSHATVITPDVKAKIEKCVPLAPLHNPSHLIGIDSCQQIMPGIPQVAVFDTAYHQTLPQQAFLYPIPIKLYHELGIRRYGFHGTSHHYVLSAYAEETQTPLENLDIITAHLGNGCSTCAIHRGKSVDTSMGLTPLEGLVMGTRCGDIDPALHEFLTENHNMSIQEITRMLNKESGLLGLSDLSHDMRTLEQEASKGHRGADLSIQVFCFRLAKSIAAMMVSTPKLEALVFTGGIGENSARVRQLTVNHLSHLGFDIDQDKNHAQMTHRHCFINTDSSKFSIAVIATDEEAMIAKETLQLI